MPKNAHDNHMGLQNQSFTEFLSAVPSPLVTVLVGLAPFIASVRHAIDIVSWQAPWEESWLAIALWWAACLLGDVALRYVLPIALLAVLFVARWTSKPHSSPPPVTEDALQRTIADLSAIHALLPRLPTTPSTALPILLRVCALLYLPYLTLTYLVRLRILVAIVGTLALTWRARWAALIRRGLWRSAWIRWGAYHAWSRLSGVPLPPRTHSPHTLVAKSAEVEKKATKTSQEIRFLFTVYENQRWWMGLDWTAALLPGERPSWCSGSQLPVAPPSAFTLPSSTTAFMMEGKTRMKRTATWRWEEEEWRVLVCKEGGSGLTRIERPVPNGDDLAAGASANRILKAAGKMRSSTLSGAEGTEDGEQPGGTGKVERSGSSASTAGVKAAEVDEEIFTDVDGWVYGDNKWEHGSNKGGMGKYTRYRRWTRIAVLSETIEPVGPGDVGIQKSNLPPGTLAPLPLPISPPSTISPPVSTTTPSFPGQLTSPPPSATTSESASVPTPSIAPCEDKDVNRLRQRLQNVVKRTSLLNTSGGTNHGRTDSTTSSGSVEVVSP
ncbi:hypothetical protein EUX98_g4327 [Antrodiella citrinella]|uniref:Peroxin/Ferlin domain-containing protein n=1 Tax=Antrodiella citrinella TaxID=2447956 RepID=A0A4S4MU91_9APHY|nr:hypothetical protein EUX98_g4327 [Antrodiella citrinella]